MANPRGQQRDKPFRDALRKAIMRADGDERRLDKVAVALIDAAAKGDVQAIKEIGDRLDGRPAQETDATVLHTYEKIVREIVHPENQDGASIPTAH